MQTGLRGTNPRPLDRAGSDFPAIRVDLDEDHYEKRSSRCNTWRARFVLRRRLRKRKWCAYVVLLLRQSCEDFLRRVARRTGDPVWLTSKGGRFCGKISCVRVTSMDITLSPRLRMPGASGGPLRGCLANFLAFSKPASPSLSSNYRP